jgi:hypothetical protein
VILYCSGPFFFGHVHQSHPCLVSLNKNKILETSFSTFFEVLLFLVPYERIELPDNLCWISLCMCLEAVVKLRGPLRRIATGDEESDLRDLIPSDHQFDILEELVKPLLLIKQVAKRLSEVKPSLHIVLAALVNILTLTKVPGFSSRDPSSQNFVRTFEEEVKKQLPDYGRTVREVG